MTRTKLSARLQTTVSMLNLTPRQRGICWLRQAGVQWVLALALALAGLGWSGKLGGSVAFVRTAIEKIGQVEAARRLINQEKGRFIDKLFESTSIANQPVRHENRFDHSNIVIFFVRQEGFPEDYNLLLYIIRLQRYVFDIERIAGRIVTHLRKLPFWKFTRTDLNRRRYAFDYRDPRAHIFYRKPSGKVLQPLGPLALHP